VCTDGKSVSAEHGDQKVNVKGLFNKTKVGLEAKIAARGCLGTR
jgi:hypothetical protein